MFLCPIPVVHKCQAVVVPKIDNLLVLLHFQLNYKTRGCFVGETETPDTHHEQEGKAPDGQQLNDNVPGCVHYRIQVVVRDQYVPVGGRAGARIKLVN